MDPPPVPEAIPASFQSQGSGLSRSESFSSDDSQTAAEFISSQLQLEADAREALPYKFDSCTRDLGPLRQLLFACLTCNPPPKSSKDDYSPAAVCYSCSVQCHGDHELVELFNKRNFVCDCGTTRLPSASPCSLRFNPATKTAGGVHSEPADENNKYNHNFRNRFCCCDCDYDPHQQKGTMFQCLGLGTVEEGGCGEDWYHPGCLVGLGPNWYEQTTNAKEGLLKTTTEVDRTSIDEGTRSNEISHGAEDEDMPPPPGFPDEEDFDGFICYKCVNANPWIKRYAGSPGFLGPVFLRSTAPSPEIQVKVKAQTTGDLEPMVEISIDMADSKTTDALVGDKVTREMATVGSSKALNEFFAAPDPPRKRKADEIEGTASSKRLKDDTDLDVTSALTATIERPGASCKYEILAPAPAGIISLFLQSGFRDYLCHCSNCFPRLAKHSQLLDEEESYEPPVSDSGDEAGGSTVGSGSIYDRGESALKNVDRVRAIEGVMAYNHLKEKLTPFFKEFAESGKAISAEDIKAHFAKMRGDETAIKQAGEAAAASGNNRREQSGY